MLRTLRKASEILVYYNRNSSTQRFQKMTSIYENSLGPAFLSLLAKGMFSDIEIVVNGESL